MAANDDAPVDAMACAVRGLAPMVGLQLPTTRNAVLQSIGTDKKGKRAVCSVRVSAGDCT